MTHLHILRWFNNQFMFFSLVPLLAFIYELRLSVEEPSRVQFLHHLSQALNAYILQDSSFLTYFLSAFSIHMFSLSLLDHFFCFFHLFIFHWTFWPLSVCTTLHLCLMLFSVDIYYGWEEGRWSLSLMTVLTGSNKWIGGETEAQSKVLSIHYTITST